MEKSLRWVIDADINIDYETMKVEFTNQDRIFSKKHLKKHIKTSMVLGSLLSIAIMVLTFAIGIPITPEYLELFALKFPLLIIGGLAITTFVLEMSATSDIPIFRNGIFRIRAWSINKKVVIPNPEGEIKYITSSYNPLIDLEYSDDVRQKLKTVTLKKIKKPKGIFKSRHGRRALMTITLKEQAQGDLIITEY